nr:hypothetical protein [Pandoravirus massiliensis]
MPSPAAAIDPLPLDKACEYSKKICNRHGTPKCFDLSCPLVVSIFGNSKTFVSCILSILLLASFVRRSVPRFFIFFIATSLFIRATCDPKKGHQNQPPTALWLCPKKREGGMSATADQEKKEGQQRLQCDRGNARPLFLYRRAPFGFFSFFFSVSTGNAIFSLATSTSIPNIKTQSS